MHNNQLANEMFNHKWHIYIAFNYIPHKILIMKKKLYSIAGKDHHNQVINTNKLKNEINQNNVSHDIIHWEEYCISSMTCLTKMYNLNVIMRKHQTNFNWETKYNPTAL